MSHGWIVSSTLALAGWGASRYTISSACAAGVKVSWLPAVLDSKEQRPKVRLIALVDARVSKMVAQYLLSVAERVLLAGQPYGLEPVGLTDAAAGHPLDAVIGAGLGGCLLPQSMEHNFSWDLSTTSVVRAGPLEISEFISAFARYDYPYNHDATLIKRSRLCRK